ncbi:MAG: undecaprenyl/decaprenyl-phosphate alpha-N-acetylglucosaminyl 1-phosphate transferase, partial [Treponema sp.]|nr:undecaprenyl/decaprenyl-phosphate alpha-N-acetylglucosaminyl 1-phosphate transferase [Treponema sp.]
MIVETLIVFSAAAVFSVILVALILRLSHHKSWYDHINDRKIHSGDVPRLGGIGFALTFVIAAVIIIVFTRKMDSIIRFLPCLIGICIIVVFGVHDDFRPMKPLYKLLIQILAALCVIIPGYTFRRIFYFDGSFLEKFPWLGYPITLLWIVGLTNAINLIDGVDGLAGGISAIIALTFGFIFLLFAETPSAAMLCIGLFGSIAGFLVFNAPIPRAKIFMGDGGSQFLGFTLALLPLLEEHQTVASLPVPYAAALLAIPIFDTTAAVWRRIRDGQRIDTPDKAHIHHKLMNMGFESRKIIAVLFGLQLMLSVLVIVSLRVPQWLSLIVLGIAYLSALAFFAVLHFLNRKAVLNSGEDYHSPIA